MIDLAAILLLAGGLASLLCGLLGNTRPLKSLLWAATAGLAVFSSLTLMVLACLTLDIPIPIIGDGEPVGLVLGAMFFIAAMAAVPVCVFIAHLAHCSAKGRPTISLGRNRRLAALGAAAVFIAAAMVIGLTGGPIIH